MTFVSIKAEIPETGVTINVGRRSCFGCGRVAKEIRITDGAGKRWLGVKTPHAEYYRVVKELK